LIPSALFPKLPDSFAECNGHALVCHPAMMNVLFTLRVAQALHGKDGA
jgi:hypothetical protein